MIFKHRQVTRLKTSVECYNISLLHNRLLFSLLNSLSRLVMCALHGHGWCNVRHLNPNFNKCIMHGQESDLTHGVNLENLEYPSEEPHLISYSFWVFYLG